MGWDWDAEIDDPPASLTGSEDEDHGLEQAEAEYYASLAEDEIAAENAWLKAAEYDPRMDDPREW